MNQNLIKLFFKEKICQSFGTVEGHMANACWEFFIRIRCV